MENLSIKITKEEKKILKEQSKIKDISVSKYVRTVLFSKFNNDTVSKQELASLLHEIAQIADREEEKNKRTAKLFRKEINKIWELL